MASSSSESDGESLCEIDEDTSSEHESSSTKAQGKKRPSSAENEEDPAIPAKKPAAESSSSSILSFFKKRDSNEAGCKQTNALTKTKATEGRKHKRDYGKYKVVCLLCAKSSKPKVMKGSILARGGEYQIERHRKSNHSTITKNEMSSNIVSLDHVSVPKSVRELEIPKPSVKPAKKTTLETIDEASEDQCTEKTNFDQSKESEDTALTGVRLQKDLTDFVTVTKQSFEEKVLTMIEKINHKVDNLKEVSASPGASTTIVPSHFSKEMKEPYLKMQEWRKVSNIVELVNAIECLELYPLSNKDKGVFEEGSGAILRCETCFTLYKDRAVKMTPPRAARKLAADCNSICTGRYLNPERMAIVMKGEGVYWRKLKSSILQHMICAGDGQTHFKALCSVSEARNLKRKHYEAAESLLKSALTAVKSKSAAMHYEEQVAFAFSVGAQVGHSGHSRKLVPDLIKCLLQAVNDRTKEELLKCLPSTGLPPHFYLAVDKATVNKRSNQGVIICPVMDGKKIPIVVAAPEVYKPTSDGGVEGGKADDSASQALKELENKFGSTSLDYLVGEFSCICLHFKNLSLCRTRTY